MAKSRTKKKEYPQLTTLPCTRVTGDLIRELNHQQGYKLMRFITGMLNGWAMLSPHQKMTAMNAANKEHGE